MEYYNGARLLSKLDLDGQKPQFYICTTNRSGGKTTFFSRFLLDNFLQKGEKFILLYRYDYELQDVSTRFFKDIGSLFFKSKCMMEKSVGKGVLKELYVGDINLQDDIEKLDIDIMSPCGYAIAINKADSIKKYSHFLTDADNILFDEFQSETNSYCPNEITKFLSIMTSVCRGHGKTFRYVRVIMLSNQVSILNPYFTEMGISTRLTSETKFLRGNGWVLENGFIEGASEAMKNSPLARAFKNNAYIAYSSENVYLNDSTAFIEAPPSEHGKYIATIKYGGNNFGLLSYPNEGILYVTRKYDINFPYRLSVTTNDHDTNYIMIKNNYDFISNLRFYFERGCFRFKDSLCKECIIKTLSY